MTEPRSTFTAAVLRASIALLMLAFGGSGLASCGGEWPGRLTSDTHEVDFSPLDSADHLRVVRIRDGSIVLQTTDPAHLRLAATFARQRQDEWIEVFPGPMAAALQLEFSRDGKHVGFFGIADAYITWGGWSRRVAPEDIEALRSRLGVPDAWHTR